MMIQPFVEGTLGSVARVGGGVFDPVSLYGTDQVRALNIGVMVGWEMRGHRMGRYGALASDMSAMPGMAGMKFFWDTVDPATGWTGREEARTLLPVASRFSLVRGRAQRGERGSISRRSGC